MSFLCVTYHVELPSETCELSRAWKNGMKRLLRVMCGRWSSKQILKWRSWTRSWSGDRGPDHGPDYGPDRRTEGLAKKRMEEAKAVPKVMGSGVHEQTGQAPRNRSHWKSEKRN